MGMDCALVVFPGAPLTRAELADLVATALTRRPGADELAVLVAPVVDDDGARLAFSSLQLFARMDPAQQRNAVVHVPQADLDAARERVKGGSLASLAREAWKLTLQGVREAGASRADDGENEREFEREPLAKLAASVSRHRGEAVWVTVCDHSVIGAHARYRDGERIAGREIDDEAYEREPDATLAAFLHVQHASVQGIAARASEASDASAFHIVHDRRLIEPKPATLADLDDPDWQPVFD